MLRQPTVHGYLTLHLMLTQLVPAVQPTWLEYTGIASFTTSSVGTFHRDISTNILTLVKVDYTMFAKHVSHFRELKGESEQC